MTKDTLISEFAANCGAMQELMQEMADRAEDFFDTHPDHISKRQLQELEKAYTMAESLLQQINKI